MDINALYIQVLRTLAEKGPTIPSNGICSNLSGGLDALGHTSNKAYDFVSTHSNGYDDFQPYGGHWHGSSWSDVQGAACDTFRRNWCATMADAIESGCIDASSY
jgi:hypothetical protein